MTHLTWLFGALLALQQLLSPHASQGSKLRLCGNSSLERKIENMADACPANHRVRFYPKK